ncbi:MAG: hypothetical protein GF331_22895 [Chitinivibrionales bacterium]|nr:hypothetical protein [Chitinivibrionales bacterium]
MKSVYALLAAAMLAATAWAGANLSSLDGVAYAIDDNGIVAVDCNTGTRTPILTRSRANQQLNLEDIYGQTSYIYEFYGVRFSPNGTRMAARYRFRIGTNYHNYGFLIADNDGSNAEHLHKLDNSAECGSDFHLSWCTDGFIYWSEYTDSIWRLDVTTKQAEVYWADVGVCGYGGDDQGNPLIYTKAVTVSRDGTRGVSSNGGKVHALDLANKRHVDTYRGGCTGNVSAFGNFVIQRETVWHFEPPIADNTHSCLLILWNFGSDPEAIDTTTVWAPGWPEATDGGNRMENEIAARNTEDYVLCDGRENNDDNSYVIATSGDNDYYEITGTRRGDFWLGTLPSPSGPRILADKSELRYESSDGNAPAAQTVTITNDGDGTLDAVTITETADWLTVTGATAGNTQLLTNTVDPTGLSGAYSTIVTVSGGGASNSVNYTVSLLVGSAIAPPTSLNANPVDNQHIELTWVDNADTETGYLVERGGAGAWSAVATLAADARTYIDSNLTPGTYTYRVRAVADTDSSDYSNEATATIVATMSLTVTAPTQGEALTGGGVYTVTWTAENVPGVTLHYSLDEGETWVDVSLPGGMIQPGEASWGAYEWTVPSQASDLCLFKVAYYQDPSFNDVSDIFSIVASAVAGGAQARRRVPGIFTQTANGHVQLVCRLDGFRAGALDVYRLDGNLVGRFVITAGAARIVDLGRQVHGALVARLRAADGTLVATRRIVSR